MTRGIENNKGDNAVLSEENREKIVFTGVYYHEPDVSKCFDESELYCFKNWYFTPQERNGRVYMVDTYWKNQLGLEYEVSDENISDFTLIIDFAKSRRIFKDEVRYYCENDVKTVLMGNRGGVRDEQYWVDNNTKKVKALTIADKLEEIEQQKAHLKKLKQELEELKTELNKEDE